MIVCPFKDLNRYVAVIPGLEEAVNFINGLENFEPATYPLSGSNKVLVQAVTTKAFETSLLEAHREFLDVQYILKGKEVVGWAPVDTLNPTEEYNAAKDKCMYEGKSYPMEIAEGYCYVVYPEDAHAPSVHLDETHEVRKIVVKLKV